MDWNVTLAEALHAARENFGTFDNVRRLSQLEGAPFTVFSVSQDDDYSVDESEQVVPLTLPTDHPQFQALAVNRVQQLAVEYSLLPLTQQIAIAGKCDDGETWSFRVAWDDVMQKLKDRQIA